jgi:uncharacterized protein (DUF362 family)
MRAVAVVAILAACGRSEAPGPAKGSAASKVTEPARPAHPVVDAETGASPKKGEGPALEVIDKVDGAALRAKHRERLAADRSAVTVLTGGTPRELGTRICEAVVPKRSAQTPVLIKPNLSGFNWFHDPRTHNGDDGVKGRITDPEFVRGVIDCLKADGYTKITVADGFTGKASDWQRLIKVSGYGAMAKQEGVALVALDDDGVFDQQGEQPGKPLGVTGMERTHVPSLLVPKAMAEHLQRGLVISVPKLKAHRFAVFSLGIKAMQGAAMYSDATPAYQQKWRSHRELDKALSLVKKNDPTARDLYVKALETFAERMVDMLELEAPDVVLVEGAPAMSGDGFETLLPSAESVAIGGTNVVMVDRVGAQFLGLWDSDALATELGGHRTSPLLEVAAKRFGVDIRQPEIAGDGAGLLAARRPAHLIGMAGFDIDSDASGPHDHADNAAAQPKELHALKVEGAPAIDGVTDEVWRAATPIEFSTDWAGRPTATPTKVRALWSPKGLYLLWELENTSANTDTSRPIDVEHVDLYEENCVELFLVPDPTQRRRYFEIELGPFGHFFDLAVDRIAKPHSDTSWSAGLRIGTYRDDANHRAVIEVAIEGPDVRAVLQPGAQLPLGLYRTEGKGTRLYLAAFPTRTPKPNFHVPEAFGTLVLDE